MTAADLNGDGWTAMVHPDELAEAAARWSEATASGDDYQNEFRLRRRAI
jgi:hypothetical protein